MIPLSIRILQPRLSNCPTDKIFFFKPFTCHTSEIIRIEPSYIFNLMVPMPTISKAWSLPMNIKPSEMGSYVWNQSQLGVVCHVALESINQTSVSFFLSVETIATSLYKTSPSSKVLATHPWGFDNSAVFFIPFLKQQSLLKCPFLPQL